MGLQDNPGGLIPSSAFSREPERTPSSTGFLFPTSSGPSFPPHPGAPWAEAAASYWAEGKGGGRPLTAVKEKPPLPWWSRLWSGGGGGTLFPLPSALTKRHVPGEREEGLGKEAKTFHLLCLLKKEIVSLP